MSVNRIWKGGLWRKGLQWATGALGLLPIGLAVFSVPVFAQIVPDNTLGSESSQVTPNVNIRGLPAERINGGAVRGSALFHSFSEFNVNNGQRVYFSNRAGIANIFSRVTGKNVSNVLGTLGVDGGANLFLLNPNGILFGPNAQLDIQGSFLATTESSFKFSDGSEFSATQPQAAPLLSINVPLGLQWGTQPLGKINNAGNLQVGSGQTLALHGSDVTSTGSLSAPGGTVMMLGDRIGLLDNARINVASATGGGTVLIGGGLQGKGAVPNATRTFVDAGVRIEADALTTGDGGNVIVWANEVTGFYGNISARGGTEAGNGGFVEVSGKQNLIFRGAVDTSASQGNPGTLLLDPENITIVNGNGAANDNQLDDKQILQGDGGALPFTISENALETLSGNTDVILQATNDITINDLGDNALTFKPGTGKITFTADADGNGVGSFLMQDVKDTLYTNGRDIEISGASLTLGNINTFSISNTKTQSRQEVVNVNAGGLIPGTGTSGTATFYFTVPDDLSTSTISGLKVRFSAEHTWDSDLDASLTSPGGTSLNLFSRVGGSGENFQDTLLDDQAATSIDQGTAPFTGSFKPVGSLASLNGQKPDGNWTLTVNDNALGDSGRLFKAGEIAPWGTAIGTQLLFQLATNQSVINPGNGKSGSMTLNATNGNISAGNLNTANSTANTGNDFSRDGGVIALTANGGNITTNGSLSSSSSSVSGNGGAITLTAGRDITTSDLSSSSSSSSFSDSFSSSSSGNGGAITLTAGRDITTNGSLYSSSFSDSFSSSSSGNGGEITLTAGRDLTTNGSLYSGYSSYSFSDSSSGSSTSKNGGAINLTAGGNLSSNSLYLNSSSYFYFFNDSSKGESGDGGKINLKARTVTIENSSIDALSITGKGGDVIIAATESSLGIPAIRLLDTSIDVTAQLSNKSPNVPGQASNNSKDKQTSQVISGRTGNVKINAGNSGSVEFRETNSTNNSYNRPRLLTAAQTNAVPENPKTGGDITITGGSVTIDGYELSAQVNQNVTGDGGNVLIETPDNGNVTIKNNAVISTTTLGDGQAGNLTIKTGNLIIENSRLEATTGSNGSTDSRNTTPAITDNKGKGGNINITAPNSITLSSNGKLSAETSGSGRAGNVVITTPTLNVNGGARVSTTTSSKADNAGKGGDITVSANTLNLSGTNSGLFAETKGAGNAGELTLKPYSAGNDLQVIFAEGAQVSASTSGSGKGGNITVSAPNSSVTLRGDRNEQGGLSASASDQATGNGGSIAINARTLVMGATIRSEATNSNAGDITLTLKDLLVLLHNSLISTTAGSAQAPGNGGNITISAPFVLASPSGNSDIIANAFSGNGGQIKIIGNYRIFGLKPQNRQSFNTLRQNRTSDISASSQSGNQGNINIQALSVDPIQGLTQLPVEVIDPSRQIVNGCGASSGTAAKGQGEFVITGRGGLPPSPDDLQRSGAITPGWVTRDVGNSSRSAAPVEPPATPSTPPLVEAQGMFINAKGEVVLTAQTPTTTPHQPGFADEFCSPARR